MNAIKFIVIGQVAQGIQLMLKTNAWYRFGVDSDPRAVLDIDYLVTGLQPEQVDFEGR